VKYWQATCSPPDICMQPVTVSKCTQIMLLH
jgi:hypothetical protein